jgi:hypothetical protein
VLDVRNGHEGDGNDGMTNGMAMKDTIVMLCTEQSRSIAEYKVCLDHHPFIRIDRKGKFTGTGGITV